jgi:phosphomevalonate kinase
MTIFLDSNSVVCRLLTSLVHSGSHINTNPFVETTLSYVLTYISRIAHRRPSHSIQPARLTILADNDYYSTPPTGTSRFGSFAIPLTSAHKTGLGSSAALVTSLTAALLTHYLPESAFSLATAEGRTTLHNLAQAAHCAAQGKVGSGFDVAAAVYGGCLYRRFSPAVLASVGEAGGQGFAERLESVVSGTAGDQSKWDVEIDADGISLPPGIAVRMCDVDCGSQTVGMVKGVLAWRQKQAESAKDLWDELQRRNEALGNVLRDGRTEDIRPAVKAIRELVRKMGTESGVPIEPESQTELLDALEGVDGVYAGVVPGAGGFDALALLVKDDEQTASRIDDFLAHWSEEKGARVKLLPVKGEMEGARIEKLDIYQGWLGS